MYVLYMIGTLTTKYGLVHAVRDQRHSLGYYTMCRRAYGVTALDKTDRVVTCVWCATGQSWPVDLKTSNPCGEIELEA